MMCCCSLFVCLFWLRRRRPLLCPRLPRTSVRRLVDPGTGKHQSTSALPVCTGPSYFITKPRNWSYCALRLGLNVEARATVMFLLLLFNLPAAVVHISSLNSAELFIVLSFPSNVRPKRFFLWSELELQRRSPPSPKGLSLFTFWFT